MNVTLNKRDTTSVARFVISASNITQDEKCIVHFAVQCVTADSGCQLRRPWHIYVVLVVSFTVTYSCRSYFVTNRNTRLNIA